MEALLRDTGDKSKKSSEKNIEEIKKLKEEIIGLNSEMELKVFLIEQLETTAKGLKSSNQDISDDLIIKKNEIIALQTKVQDEKNSNLVLTQNLATVTAENDAL